MKTFKSFREYQAWHIQHDLFHPLVLGRAVVAFISLSLFALAIFFGLRQLCLLWYNILIYGAYTVPNTKAMEIAAYCGFTFYLLFTFLTLLYDYFTHPKTLED